MSAAGIYDCIRAINQAGGAIKSLDDRLTRLENQVARLSDLLGVLVEQLDGRGVLEFAAIQDEMAPVPLDRSGGVVIDIQTHEVVRG